MGQSSDAEELLNRALCYLRDARDLLPMDQEERALQALSVYLHLREKAVQPLLIQARSIIEREEHEESLRRAKLEQEERIRQAKREEEARLAREQAEREERKSLARTRKEEQRIASDGDVDLLKGLQGSDTVSIEGAAQVLGHEDTRYVTRLRNEGTLKHKPKREDLITVASLRAYLAKHPKRTPLTIVRMETEARAVADQESEPVADQETTA